MAERLSLLVKGSGSRVECREYLNASANMSIVTDVSRLLLISSDSVFPSEGFFFCFCGILDTLSAGFLRFSVSGSAASGSSSLDAVSKSCTLDEGRDVVFGSLKQCDSFVLVDDDEEDVSTSDALFRRAGLCR